MGLDSLESGEELLLALVALVASAVGILVSLFRALTQIQEGAICQALPQKDPLALLHAAPFIRYDRTLFSGRMVS
ncbi:flagellar biosynthetic protein FliQ [Sodalis sp.]|uniref:flagellar biosynthetic protein FliQ n=1 Tax=Sodalis sp. (in: enterobacteria) TaxID=1898979 RepID=UPI003872FD84